VAMEPVPSVAGYFQNGNDRGNAIRKPARRRRTFLPAVVSDISVLQSRGLERGFKPRRDSSPGIVVG